MKSLTMLAMLMGLTARLYAEPLLTDIASYEALVIDDATGVTLATGGPWVWEDPSFNQLTGSIVGPGRTIVVKCRNAEGTTIFGATATGLDLSVPWSPFDPPDSSGSATLTFYGESEMLAVYLNGQYVTDMVLVPAEDDPSPFQTVMVDIIPESTVNTFNIQSKGMVPVAILGSPELNVSQIDPASIKLAGLGPVRQSISDLQGDGFPDTLLHFRGQDIAGLLTGGVTNGAVVELELSGTLLDGTAIRGSDSVTVVLKPNRH